MGARYVADSPARPAAGVWSNDSTAYYYQGLSDDGKYYISFWWPVSTSALPETADAAAPDVQQLASSPETSSAYVAETAEMLNNFASEAFLPDLSQLDAMIGSLTIGD